MYTFIDVFAGIGGIRSGFEQAGFQCIWSNDFDKFSLQTYCTNFGFNNHLLADIKSVDMDSIPYSDIITAGFPCQPFSIAGVSKLNSLHRKHGFDNEEKGSLFFDLINIISAKQPKIVFLENVKNLVRHDKGNTFSVIRNELESLGYTVNYKIFNSNLLVPQNRERIYIVAIKGDQTFNFPEIISISPKLSDILEPVVNEKYTLTDKLWNYLQEHAEKHRQKGNGFGYGLANINSYSRTLSARYFKDGSEILIPQNSQNPRRLTPRECARLQGFPDSFKIPVSDTQAYKQFGNSVSVPIIFEIAKELKSQLEKSLLNNTIVLKNKISIET